MANLALQPWAFSGFSFFPARSLLRRTDSGDHRLRAAVNPRDQRHLFQHCRPRRPEYGDHVLAPLRWRPLRYIGQVSYGLYLYHFLVIESVHKYFGLRSLTTDLSAAVLSVLASVISWECLEKPIGNLKRWFPYENRGLHPIDPAPAFEGAVHRSPGAPLKTGGE